jgi:glycosyltransferase involved in cell wall biosynthesis
VRVLLVSDWPRLAGGTERYLSDLRGGLEAAGHEVRLLASSTGAGAGGTAEYVAGTTDSRPAQALLQVANPAAVTTLRRALREFDPDAVHAAMVLGYLSPAVLAPLRHRTATMMVTDLKPVCPKGTKLLEDGSQCRVPMGAVCRRSGCLGTARAARDLVRYAAFRREVRGIDDVLATSAHVERELAAVGIPSRHVPLPVAPPPRGWHRAPAAEPTFVYAGRLAPVKGLDLLLRAFALLRGRHPKARLRICGDGVERGSVAARIGELGLTETVSLKPMRWEWTSDLADAWALVAPSLYREPLGLVAIEAIVRDVPVVASSDGGFAETVADGASGLLFPNGDADALAERLARVCEGAFPDHHPRAEARAVLARRHDLGDHVRAMEGIWKGAAR